MTSPPDCVYLRGVMTSFQMLLAAAAASVMMAGAGARAEPLTPAEMAGAVRADAVTIPTPGELMAALAKAGKPNWQAYFRQPIPTGFTSRPQIALNLGGLIADGYIAIEAEDGQQVKNIGKDVIALARTLNVSENVIARGNSIIAFAESNEWETLKEEMEATQNEVKLAMLEQGDEALITLVTLGGWIRGTEVVTSWIADNYSPELARLIRQPAIVSFLRGKVEALPERLRGDGSVKAVAKELADIQELVSFPAGESPPATTVQQLRDEAKKLVAQIVEVKK